MSGKMSGSETTTKYIGQYGQELSQSELAPDLSNVFAVIKTEAMTIRQFMERYPDAKI